MSIVYTDEQKELRQLVADFMRKEVEPYKAQWDREGHFPLETYKKACSLGLHVMEIPEEYGGAGLDHATMAMIFEEMGYWDAGFAITCGTSMVQGLKATLLFGNEEQKKMLADIVVNGGFCSYVLTEPNTGSDASSLTTTYVQDGDDYIINGTKCFATTGAYADILFVFATRDKKLGKDGVSAFIVPSDTPGITIGKHEDKMGLRLSNTCEIAFDNVRVPAKNLVGGEGHGMRVAFGTLNLGRLEAAAVATGITRRALEESVKYAKVRSVFGKPIIDHQMVTQMLADMAVSLEASRALVHSGMQAFDHKSEDVRLVASAAKIFCTDNAVKATQDAIQVFGGYGYSKEYPVEKLYRDAKVFQIFEGTNQIQRIVVGRELKKLY